MLFHYFYALTLLLVEISNQSEANQIPGIPDDVYNKLRGARSRSDLGKFGIIAGSLPPIVTAGWITSGPNGPPANATIISDPIQSEDKCILMDVCVPVPIAKEHSIFSFPQCIELPQCVGACCDGQHQCHAEKTLTVTVMVEKWLYGGSLPDGETNWLPKGTLWVHMEKHLSCACDTCLQRQTCSNKHQFSQCRCQCRDRSLADKCTQYQFWSEDICTCECQKSTPICPYNMVWNRQACKCVSSLTGPTNGVSRVGILNGNFSSLRNIIRDWFKSE